MRIKRIIWLRDIVDKLWSKHGVSTDGVEEVFRSKPRFRFIERGRIRGEDVYAALGQTDAGRYLIIFFIRKPGDAALVISARDMDAKERRRYGKEK